MVKRAVFCAMFVGSILTHASANAQINPVTTSTLDAMYMDMVAQAEGAQAVRLIDTGARYYTGSRLTDVSIADYNIFSESSGSKQFRTSHTATIDTQLEGSYARSNIFNPYFILWGYEDWAGDAFGVGVTGNPTAINVTAVLSKDGTYSADVSGQYIATGGKLYDFNKIGEVVDLGGGISAILNQQTFTKTADSMTLEVRPFTLRFTNYLVDGVTLNGDMVLNRLVLSSPIATSAVVEPGSWAMLIMGFGVAGGTMRAKRRRAVRGIALIA